MWNVVAVGESLRLLLVVGEGEEIRAGEDGGGYAPVHACLGIAGGHCQTGGVTTLKPVCGGGGARRAKGGGAG
jgi:hypothetical protein